MPAQKRPSSNHRQNNEEPSSQHRPRRKQSRGSGSAVDQLPTSSSSTLPQSCLQQQQQQQQQHQEHHPNEEQQEDQPAVSDQDPVEETQQDGSEGSGTDPEEFDEIITVLRSELRNNVQCPICLGIIKKTRTVMGCLHRFCRECIDKSMRLGNNECPACRIHCASRRSLRDDQDFDKLIKAIYPDAKKYEEEELMFCEEDKTRNEQIQASIEQISRRQSEALNKKRKSGKEVDDSSEVQISRTFYNSYSRRRKKNQKIEVEEFDGNEKDDPSSSGNHGNEIKHKGRKRRRTGTQQLSSISASTGGNSEEMCISLKAIRKPENFTWGRGGARSSRLNRESPLFKLIDCLEGVTIPETEPKRELSEIKALEPLLTKNTITSNEYTVKSETSSPNVTRPDVLDRNENPVEVTCPSGNNEQLVGDIHA